MSVNDHNGWGGKPAEPTTGISARQLEANRRNAQKSTGPKTKAGKILSSRNAVRHGGYASIAPIDRGYFQEDPAELEAMVEDYMKEFAPVGTVERDQVREIARCRVNLDRFDAAETLAFTHMTTYGKFTNSTKFSVKGVDRLRIVHDVQALIAAIEVLARPEAGWTAQDWDVLLMALALAMVTDNGELGLEELHRTTTPDDADFITKVRDGVTAALDKLGADHAEAASALDTIACDLAETIPSEAQERADALLGVSNPDQMRRYSDSTRTRVRISNSLAAAIRRFEELRALRQPPNAADDTEAA